MASVSEKTEPPAKKKRAARATRFWFPLGQRSLAVPSLLEVGQRQQAAAPLRHDIADELQLFAREIRAAHGARENEVARHERLQIRGELFGIPRRSVREEQMTSTMSQR